MVHPGSVLLRAFCESSLHPVFEPPPLTITQDRIFGAIRTFGRGVLKMEQDEPLAPCSAFANPEKCTVHPGFASFSYCASEQAVGTLLR